MPRVVSKQCHDWWSDLLFVFSWCPCHCSASARL